MKLRTEFTKDPIYQVALKIDGALDTVAVIKDEGVAEKLAQAYNLHDELLVVLKELLEYQSIKNLRQYDNFPIFGKIDAVLAKIKPTCPECTNPFPLPAGLDRCRECEIQDYTGQNKLLTIGVTMSEEKKDFDYEPSPEDLKEMAFTQFSNDLDSFAKTVVKDVEYFAKYENDIYKLRDKLSDVWSIIRSYQKIVAITEKKA